VLVRCMTDIAHRVTNKTLMLLLLLAAGWAVGVRVHGNHRVS
jgi:hypothetical protein